ncbi:hypothetical protein ABFS82_03G096400 [Erythranthe guttata]
METNRGTGDTKTPSLMVSHGKEGVEKHLIYNISKKWFRILDTATLRHKKVLGSIYGWLVLVDPRNDDCCLFNPISEDLIMLPKLDSSDTYNQCILIKPPTDADCYILFNGLEQSFCRIGDEEYVTRTLEQQEEDGLNDLLAIVYFEGKIYGFMGPNMFVTIHFVEKTIEFRQIPMVNPWVISNLSNSCLWLIESAQPCGNELFMIQNINHFLYSNERLDFKVFRVDTKQMNYVEVENMGDRTIFVSDNGAGYCCPSIGTKPNSIYYTNENDRNLHIFNLEDRSTSSILVSRAIGANMSMTSWVQHNIFHN